MLSTESWIGIRKQNGNVENQKFYAYMRVHWHDVDDEELRSKEPFNVPVEDSVSIDSFKKSFPDFLSNDTHRIIHQATQETPLVKGSHP